MHFAKMGQGELCRGKESAQLIAAIETVDTRLKLRRELLLKMQEALGRDTHDEIHLAVFLSTLLDY
jgi:hypothetical protein